ncbi:unnamed protein product [Paramecium sonneborni]|uniref:Alpha-carbonic anhydrase domain-containing protein n=1 Tax=Paramecium sonneborni TaxID=65129 RepID=A0A8S1MIM9_9CILI|nr:unnamed protein product [Paramecium sonneborni]
MILPLLILSVKVVYGSDDYDYIQNGRDWPNIHEYCFGKQTQSPVNLDNNYTNTNEDDMYFFPKYKPTNVRITKNATSHRIIPANDSDNFGPLYTVNSWSESVAYGGKIIFFRSEAEHTVNGVQYNLEVQIQHTLLFATLTNRSTVSVFFIQDDTASRNPFLQSVIDNYDKQEFTLDLSQLVTSSFSIQPYYLYAGSFTYPDCTERNSWYIFERPFKAPNSQLQFFYNLYHNTDVFPHGNFRFIQDRKSSAKKVKVYYRKDPYQSQQNEE